MYACDSMYLLLPWCWLETSASRRSSPPSIDGCSRDKWSMTFSVWIRSYSLIKIFSEASCFMPSIESSVSFRWQSGTPCCAEVWLDLKYMYVKVVRIVKDLLGNQDTARRWRSESHIYAHVIDSLVSQSTNLSFECKHCCTKRSVKFKRLQNVIK